LLAVERVDDVGAPAGDTSGVDLASETKTSVVSPQHANPKQTDDASTLVKDVLGVSLVPEITVQSVPNATSSPSVDQEVPSVFHPVPFRFSFDPPSDPASVDAFIKAYPNLPGYHMWSTWDNLCSSGRTSGRSGQAECQPEKRVIWPRTSSTASLTMPGQGCPQLPVGSARTWLQQQYYSERFRSHPPPRGGESRESSRISWRMPRSDGPKAPPPEGKGTPRSIAPRLPDSCGKPRSTPGA
jgi:hypothetical protein